MEFFISSAYAEGGAAAQGGQMGGFVLLAVMMVMFYFILIRPQQKRMKEHRSLVESLSKGDEVVTEGGILARITEVGESFVSIEAAKGVEIKVQKSSVRAVMPKGTIKNL